MPKILSIGEATLDSFMFIHDANVHCTIDKTKCEFCMNYADKVAADKLAFSVGGNAANTAVAFARLGFESQLFSMLGNDWIAERIQAALTEEKIDCRYIEVEPGPTSYATAIVFKGERNLVIYHVPRQYRLPQFEPVDWVYLTSMGEGFAPAYQQALQFVKTNNVKLAFNPGTHQLKAGPEALKPLLAVTMALFLNTDEARLVSGLSTTASFRELAEALYDLGPKSVNITDGPNGAYNFDGQQLLFCDIFPAEVLERTGCGDSYASGFTSAFASGQSASEAMRWGMANSSGVVAAIGPQEGLLHQTEMQAVLKANAGIVPHPVS
jgi:ribokinase